MTDKIRLLLSIEPKTIEVIDNVVKAINETKESWRSQTNRQSIINGLVKFALEQDVSYSSGFSKDVTVRHKKKVIDLV